MTIELSLAYRTSKGDEVFCKIQQRGPEHNKNYSSSEYRISSWVGDFMRKRKIREILRKNPGESFNFSEESPLVENLDSNINYVRSLVENHNADIKESA